MRYPIAIAAALCGLALSACDRPTVVVPAAAPATVAVPGPAGPQGAPGAPAEKGDTGATGSTGAMGSTGATGSTGMAGVDGAKGEKGRTGGDTIVVVPAPASAELSGNQAGAAPARRAARSLALTSRKAVRRASSSTGW